MAVATTGRRLGAESSASRAALMEAVETVMRDDGYGALTARSVATKAGLKHQLVYYYFETLDDLLVATYERHIERYRSRVKAAMDSPTPLRAFWDAQSSPEDAALNMEFLSLANHNAAIRARTIAFGEVVRRLGLERMDALIHRPAAGAQVVTPFAITMAISAIGSILGLENAIGISGGHAETRAMIEWCIDQIEPRQPTADVAPDGEAT